ncbi:Helix-turn-helix domain-containing protein [Micromonospora rhizosphaerae]|uniref:Helix-turn-helix domain-containing protein n=1 Tax=Micromonospora rhizosphaerae TaxID=568872 RepID=A0A1C6T6W3_9ACTN|nr:helix-turn-helix transcriptional regulator [Micromonospora rhizosphaerae]SCL37185.1 Helix-turn-helix domain-containing protein [Micromonospora rhizosphaerae]
MPLSASPVIRRLRLGAELRRLRHRTSLTLEQVCGRLGWASTSKLSRMELGQSRPDLVDVLDLLDVYEVSPGQREALILIARDAAAGRGWSRALGGMGERQRAYAELEAGAARIVEYQPAVVPGLLQTREYARLRVTAGAQLCPEVDVAADVRATRQEVLHRSRPPRYTALLDERACDPGGTPGDVWREQLQHLVTLADRPNVTIRLVSRDAVPHGGIHALTPFSHYAFPDPADPRMVMVETLTTDLRLVAEADVARYERLVDWLLAAALPAAETASLLARQADRPVVPRTRAPTDDPVVDIGRADG